MYLLAVIITLRSRWIFVPSFPASCPLAAGQVPVRLGWGLLRKRVRAAEPFWLGPAPWPFLLAHCSLTLSLHHSLPGSLTYLGLPACRCARRSLLETSRLQQMKPPRRRLERGEEGGRSGLCWATEAEKAAQLLTCSCLPLLPLCLLRTCSVYLCSVHPHHPVSLSPENPPSAAHSFGLGIAIFLFGSLLNAKVSGKGSP